MAQPPIPNFFQSKKVNASEKAFNQQLENLNQIENKNPSDGENCCDHIEQIKSLKTIETDLRQKISLVENKAGAFEKQCKENKEKYDKLKVKYIQLLQRLLEKENHLQSLTKKLHRAENADEPESEVNVQEVNFFSSY